MTMAMASRVAGRRNHTGKPLKITLRCHMHLIARTLRTIREQRDGNDKTDRDDADADRPQTWLSYAYHRFI